MSVPKLRFKHEDGTEFPEWEEKRLKKISDIYDGTHQTPKYVSKGIPFVSVEDINDLAHTSKFISEDEYNTYKIKPQVNDIFMTRITAGVIGATAVVKSNNPMGYYVSLALLRPDNKMIISEYLSQFIGSYYFRKELHKRIIHTAFPKKINKEDIGKCNTVFPCLEEQKKIADFLSTVDEVIAQSEAEVKNLEQQKKGAMQKIFSQEVRFKRDDGAEFPEWKERTIGEYCDILDNMRKPITKKDRKKGIYAYYGSTSIQDYVDGYIFDEPLVLLGEDGAPFMDFREKPIAQLATGKYWVNNHAHCLRPHGNVAFFFYSIVHKDIREYINNPNRAKLNQEDMVKIVVPVPCPEEQQKIADFLSAYDEAITYAKQELEHWKQLKKGLLQQMFV